MDIKYGNSDNSHRGNPSISFFIGDPFARQRLLQTDMEQQYRKKRLDKKGPLRPPPFGRYTVVGVIVGMIVGGVLGYPSVGRAVLFALAGVIPGGIIGTEIGSFIGKRRESKDQHTKDPS